MSRRVHKLKTVRPFYQALQDGLKSFEIRFNDRDYRPGDYLHLCEWDGEAFTGRNAWRRVSYVMSAESFGGLKDGFVALGFGEEPDYQTRARLAQETGACCPVHQDDEDDGREAIAEGDYSYYDPATRERREY